MNLKFAVMSESFHDVQVLVQFMYLTWSCDSAVHHVVTLHVLMNWHMNLWFAYMFYKATVKFLVYILMMTWWPGENFVQNYSRNQYLTLQYNNTLRAARDMLYGATHSTCNLSNWVEGHSDRLARKCHSLRNAFCGLLGWLFPLRPHRRPRLCVALSYLRPRGQRHDATL
jgi:hypothetical protein